MSVESPIEYPEVRRFVVDRERWLRGEKEAKLLRVADKRMCCLGFLACASGAEPDHILGHGEPGDTWPERFLWPQWARWFEVDEDADSLSSSFAGHYGEWNESRVISDAMSINDDLSIDDATREAKLVALFASVGVELVFE